MQILVVGSGAREHALCWRLARDPGVDRVVCAPGNAGSHDSSTTIPVDSADPDAILALAEQRANRPDRGRPGGAPGRRGHRPLQCPWPADFRSPSRRRAARNEQGVRQGLHAASRRAHRAISRLRAPPRRHWRAFRSGEFGDAVVVKADGLAAGKGVVVGDSRAEAEAAIRRHDGRSRVRRCR